MNEFQVSDAHLKGVYRMSPLDRFRYFVKKVADWEMAWGLWSDGGWCMTGGGGALEAFPLWPARRFAEECSKLFSGSAAQAEPILLEALMAELVPKLTERGLLTAIFPDPEGRSVICEPSEIETALRNEVRDNY
jgi:hypothetical protein